ncbi:hypothetical protein DIPPA_11206 [Diplonema papillatum]|nr:hypothetical protein DIPPA_11206 [Diplonema papillatum]
MVDNDALADASSPSGASTDERDGEWITPEAAAKILGGDFAGSDVNKDEISIKDTDGDTTTFAFELGRVSVFVLYHTGKKQRAGTAKEICVNVDTRQVNVLFDQAEGEEPRAWGMSVDKAMGAEEGEDLLKGMYAVCRRTAAVGFVVKTENGLRSSETPVLELCRQYSRMLGCGTVPVAKDAEVFLEGEKILKDLQQMQKDMHEVRRATLHLEDDVMPGLVVAAQQLEVIFSAVDILHGWVDDVELCMKDLETVVSTHTQSNSIMARMSSFFTKKPSRPSRPDILTVGGQQPAAWEDSLAAKLAKFTRISEEHKLPTPEERARRKRDATMTREADGEEDENET